MDPLHLAALKLHDACRGLTQKQIVDMADRMQVICRDAGDFIQKADEPDDSLYVVIQGRLRLYLSETNPDQTLRYISSGDQFGLLAVLTEEASAVNVIVDQPAVLLKLTRDQCFQLAKAIPRFRHNLLQKLGWEIKETVLHEQDLQTVRKVVAFVTFSENSLGIVAEIASQLASLGERVGVLCDSRFPEVKQGVDVEFIDDPMGSWATSETLQAKLKQWYQIDRVFIVSTRDKACDSVHRLFEMTDQVLFLVETKIAEGYFRELEKIIDLTPAWRNKAVMVWNLESSEPVAPQNEQVNKLFFRDFKIQKNLESQPEHHSLRRVIHFLRGVCVGIACSGGAAHGMAHLGVLQALEECGITIDKLAGTSAGTLTGVVYCSGREPQWAARQFEADVRPDFFLNWLPKGDGLYLLGKYRTNSWDGMLRSYLHDWRLEQLPIPAFTVTTDLISATSVVRKSGDAVHSILESINLPVLSSPICRDGRMLVDGGLLNNLPADVLVEEGCNFIIGVDVAAHIDQCVSGSIPSTRTEDMKAPGVVPAMLRCFQVLAHNMSLVGANAADITVAPDVSDFSPTDFTKASEMAAIGYEAAQAMIPRIRQRLSQLDNQLFKEG